MAAQSDGAALVCAHPAPAARRGMSRRPDAASPAFSVLTPSWATTAGSRRSFALTAGGGAAAAEAVAAAVARSWPRAAGTAAAVAVLASSRL